MNARPFEAKYPGKCLCGASFKAGARIYWDGSVRRATGCPSCASPKLIPGECREVGGMCWRFDLHPTTREVAALIVTDPCGCGLEVYRLRDGRWNLSSMGREPVYTGTLTHERIEAVRMAA